MSKKELFQYIVDVDNGLYKTIDRPGIKIGLVYWPSQLLALQEVRGRKLTGKQIDSVNAHFQEIDYFLLRLSTDSGQIEGMYASNEVLLNELNSYLSFGIAGNVYLIQEADTIQIADLSRVATFGSSPSTDILFAFEHNLKGGDNDVKFVFDDVKFGTGLNEFHFDISDIQQASSIQIIDNDL